MITNAIGVSRCGNPEDSQGGDDATV